MVPAFDGRDDLVGIGGPDEGFGIGIALCEEAIDRGLEIDQRTERASFQPSLGQLGEEALDGIEPGRRFCCVMEHQARMVIEPSPQLGGCLWLA